MNSSNFDVLVAGGKTEEQIMPHEFDGEAYKQSSTHQKEWGNKIISEFDLMGDEHILDLGCGDGTIPASFRLLESKTSTTGVIVSTYVRDGAIKIASF